jgi:hypothetical protein
MNVRPLNNFESENLAALNSSGAESILLFVTQTGLDKSILDATEPMRRLLERAGIHNYAEQGQGPDNKVIKEICILEPSECRRTSVSLYRPVTKSGDPRFWISSFKNSAQAGDVCAIFAHAKSLYLLNLTQFNLTEILKTKSESEIAIFLNGLKNSKNIVALELLGMLKAIAVKGPLKSICAGDTSIGRTIETALGIKINSRTDPDYKGIEIKSGRSHLTQSQTRASLFACVPNWKISSYKSSGAILNKFGYNRNEDFKLYCTVSTRANNSQGLRLKFDEVTNWLREIYHGTPPEDVCIWELAALHTKLKSKHKETFWVKANKMKIGGHDYFELDSVFHTNSPSCQQFDRLLIDGSITVDHLIKKTPSGGAQEKGPLFKIEKPRISELFLGESKTYSLLC